MDTKVSIKFWAKLLVGFSLLTMLLVAFLPHVALAIKEKDRHSILYNTPYFEVCDPNEGPTNEDPSLPGDGPLGNAVQVNEFTGPRIQPTGIVLHWTAGEYDTPQQLIQTLRSRNRQVQLTVDKEGVVYQLSQSLETRPIQTVTDQGWNDKTIGIEIESGSFGEDFAAYEQDLLNNDAQFQVVLGLVRDLMARYNIRNEVNISAKRGIFGHFDINAGNQDPGRGYMERIRTSLGTEPPAGNPNAPGAGAATGEAGANCVCPDGAALAGSNNAQMTFNFFISKGLSPEQAAAIVGNLQQESGINPNSVQPGGDGRGIAQWDKDDRWLRMQSYARATNQDPLSLGAQLEFIWFELTGEPPTPGAEGGGSERMAYAVFSTTTTLEAAVRAFSTEYERAGTPHMENRIQQAQAALDAYGGQVTPGGSGSCVSGVGGIDVFPLNTTKSAILAGAEGGVWCYQAETNCHGVYNAADIHVAVGTEVVAAKAGRVVGTTDQIGSTGSNVIILGGDGQYTYYYTHMQYGSIQVSEGDEVQAGQVIGAVGESAQAAGTAPHLHYDMLPQSEHQTRPGCSRHSTPNCSVYPFIDVQPLLKQVYEGTVPD